MFPILQVGHFRYRRRLVLVDWNLVWAYAAEKATKRTGVNPAEIGNLVFFAGIVVP